MEALIKHYYLQNKFIFILILMVFAVDTIKAQEVNYIVDTMLIIKIDSIECYYAIKVKRLQEERTCFILYEKTEYFQKLRSIKENTNCILNYKYNQWLKVENCIKEIRVHDHVFYFGDIPVNEGLIGPYIGSDIRELNPSNCD